MRQDHLIFLPANPDFKNLPKLDYSKRTDASIMHNLIRFLRRFEYLPPLPELLDDFVWRIILAFTWYLNE